MKFKWIELKSLQSFIILFPLFWNFFYFISFSLSPSRSLSLGQILFELSTSSSSFWSINFGLNFDCSPKDRKAKKKREREREILFGIVWSGVWAVDSLFDPRIVIKGEKNFFSFIDDDFNNQIRTILFIEMWWKESISNLKFWIDPIQISFVFVKRNCYLVLWLINLLKLFHHQIVIASIKFRRWRLHYCSLKLLSDLFYAKFSFEFSLVRNRFDYNKIINIIMIYGSICHLGRFHKSDFRHHRHQNDAVQLNYHQKRQQQLHHQSDSKLRKCKRFSSFSFCSREKSKKKRILGTIISINQLFFSRDPRIRSETVRNKRVNRLDCFLFCFHIQYYDDVMKRTSQSLINFH